MRNKKSISLVYTSTSKVLNKTMCNSKIIPARLGSASLG